MLEWVKVLAFVPAETFIKKVKAGNHNICVVYVEGKFYAVSARCPHASGELSGGWCKNGFIVCPLHRYEYNLKTGKGAAGQGDYIDTFPVEVRADGVYVQVKKRWLFFGLG